LICFTRDFISYPKESCEHINMFSLVHLWVPWGCFLSRQIPFRWRYTWGMLLNKNGIRGSHLAEKIS
jgi:hypothetical protein